MTSKPNLWHQLAQLKDELSLQAHLMSMELQDEWQALQSRFAKLENKLETDLVETAKHLGEVEENFFVGDADEIDKLIAEFKQLKGKQQP